MTRLRARLHMCPLHYFRCTLSVTSHPRVNEEKVTKLLTGRITIGGHLWVDNTWVLCPKALVIWRWSNSYIWRARHMHSALNPKLDHCPRIQNSIQWILYDQSKLAYEERGPCCSPWVQFCELFRNGLKIGILVNSNYKRNIFSARSLEILNDTTDSNL